MSDDDKFKLNDYVSTDTSVCVDWINEDDRSGPCSHDVVINALKTFYKDKAHEFIPEDLSRKEIYEKVKNYMKCDDEVCVILNEEFLEYIEKTDPDFYIKIIKSLETFFKPFGPRYNSVGITGQQILNVLSRWVHYFERGKKIKVVVEHDFFTLKDFEAMITKNKKMFTKTFIQVFTTEKINLDHCDCLVFLISHKSKTNDHLHLQTIFCDFRDDKEWTLEFFCSLGYPPEKEIISWVNIIIDLLKIYNKNVSFKNATNIIHQGDFTSNCGIYVLFFIRARLEQTGLDLNKYKIKDEDITEFRKHLFRSK